VVLPSLFLFLSPSPFRFDCSIDEFVEKGKRPATEWIVLLLESICFSKLYFLLSVENEETIP
jgi:hypothetical protein